MEKVKFWKNTSSEFDKITSKDANTIYYLTDTGKIYLGEKMYGGTDMPFTTINTTNKSEFTTLKGILDHPDGMYLVDDCGVTNGDPQLTIASFKGHCSTMLLASIAQFNEIVDADEMKCYKGSVIYIQTDGDISDSSATRYVSMYNIPMGVSGEVSDPRRAMPDAGTSVVNIEIYPVEDRSHFPITYSYDIDGGTKTFFTQPAYESMLISQATALVAGGMITGKSSYSPGQLIQVIEDKDAWSNGCIFKGVDASDFKSPFTIITNENATNYNTLDKLCHLGDGLYLCKDTYKANQDYIVDITFKGIDLLQSVGGIFGGTEPTPENTTVRCKNGCLISVSTITSVHKNIRITQSAESISNDNDFCGDIYISAQADSGDTENPVYGVTGDSVNYIRPFNYNSLLSTYFPSAVLKNAFGAESQYLNGKLAKWEKAGDGVVLTGVDIKENPIIEVNDSNWSEFDSLDKWFTKEPGVYYINCTPTKNNAGNIQSYKSITAGFTFPDPANNNTETTVTDKTIDLPYRCYVYVNKVDNSGGGWYRDTNVYFPIVSGTNLDSGKCSNRFLNFTHSLLNSSSPTPASIHLVDYGMYMVLGEQSYESILYLSTIFGDLSESDTGKVVKIANSDNGGFQFQAADITLIGNSTAVTPAQVLAAVNEGRTTTISHTDTTHGTFKFTSFGVISAASGDTVSSSITHGTGADSLTLYTLIGDVTNGTWNFYPKSLTVNA